MASYLETNFAHRTGTRSDHRGKGRCHQNHNVTSRATRRVTNAKALGLKMCVGKRNFPGQRQRPRNASFNPIGRLQRQNACTNRRQFGAIRTEPGNLCLRETAWWGWEMLQNHIKSKP